MKFSNFPVGKFKHTLSRQDILRYSIPLPPTKTEQTAIAKALSDIDALLRRTGELIEKKRAVKQGAMQELLSGRRRLDGFDKERGYKKTEIGLIPDDWKAKELGDYSFVTKLAGFEYTLHFDYSIGGEIIAIRGLNIKGGKLDLEDVHTIPIATSKMLKRSMLNKGDLVVSYVGTLGQVAVIPEDNKFHLAPNVAKVTVNQEKVDPFFLNFYLSSSVGQNNIQKLAASTTQAALSMENLRKVVFPLPPTLNEQKSIAQILSKMDAEIQTLEQKQAKYRALKQGMMQELLTGKTRLV